MFISILFFIDQRYVWRVIADTDLQIRDVFADTDLEIRDVFEDERIADADLLADLLVHRVDVRLVDGHALARERRRVVDGRLVQLRVVGPVLVCHMTQPANQRRRGHSANSPAPRLATQLTAGENR